MSAPSNSSRAVVPLETTVYDALPTLQTMHEVNRDHFPDMRETVFWEVFERMKPFTCLNAERFYNIYKSVEYIAQCGIAGHFAECGVFLGGSIIGAAHFAEHFGLGDRKFYVFDTFEGFPTDTMEKDIAGATYDLSTLTVFNNNFRAVVEKNIAASKLDPSKFILIQGLVEETLPSFEIDALAYLRLDTDYYESTLVELDCLYPHLSRGGVVILDDYGHFDGVRQATDDYFRKIGGGPLLQRVDYTGRCGVKISE